MARTSIELKDITVIGRNGAYAFAVGRVGDRWIGFARSEEPAGIFVFAEVAEGVELGLPDRRAAILMTGAIAQDVEHAYGGVEEWFVGPELRGNPDDYRCVECDQVGCTGDCNSDCGEDGLDGP